MNELSRNIRYQHWLQLIQEQKQSGLTIKQWCLDNNIKLKTYEYYQHKLRDFVLEAKVPQLVEIKQPALAGQLKPNLENSTNSAATICAGNVVISLNNNASEDLIARIVKVLHAQ